MLGSKKQTLGRVLGHLVLLLAPFALSYWGVVMAIGTRLDGWGQRLFMLGALIAFGFMLFRTRRLLLRVPFGQAFVLVQRNCDRSEIRTPGYHLLPPFWYEKVGLITISPTNHEILLHNVVMQNGRTCSLRATYTGQHLVPAGVDRLPRTGISNTQAQFDQQVLTNIAHATWQPDNWDRSREAALEHGLRDFFNRVPSTQLYDPAGKALMPMGQLIALVNTSLTPAMAGYKIGVQTIEWLAVPQTARATPPPPFFWVYGFPAGQAYNAPPQNQPNPIPAEPQSTSRNGHNSW